jgi:peptidoglycan/xylan/chitin deacetylase (PgdA/CDA1 family)
MALFHRGKAYPRSLPATIEEDRLSWADTGFWGARVCLPRLDSGCTHLRSGAGQCWESSMGRVGVWRKARALVCVLVLIQVLVGYPSPMSAMAQPVSVRVPILAYHNVDYSGSEYSVTPEQLDEQCRWLIDNGYTAITLWQFWDAAMGSGTLPANPVLLTNDDGWSSAMTFAEILGWYGLPATYFINNVSPLTPDQILVLSQFGPVQAHTVTHAHLSGMDYESQMAEIANNMAYLEQITGQPIHFISWPWGRLIRARYRPRRQPASSAGSFWAARVPTRRRSIPTRFRAS